MRWHTLVFIDVDGTLLRHDYTSTSDRIPGLIKTLVKRGYLFCLNSNRSSRDLLPIAKQFGINGPLIAENGVYWLWRGKRHLFVEGIRSIRPILRAALRETAQTTGANVLFADTTHYSWQKLSRTKLAWVANKFRDWTGSIHVRHYGHHDIRGAKALARLLNQSLGNQYDIRVSPIFTNVLVTPRGCDKGRALAILMRRHFPGSHVIMIGDDAADATTRRVVDALYAVANAEPQVKRQADSVARLPYTRGVVEILRSLD
ncbi:HAD family phosphatase [Candidatus Parcubacteria bacterium]|nr:HAD family phosphatase [Candidatus Parcubacteria bacterium]